MENRKLTLLFAFLVALTTAVSLIYTSSILGVHTTISDWHNMGLKSDLSMPKVTNSTLRKPARQSSPSLASGSSSAGWTKDEGGLAGYQGKERIFVAILRLYGQQGSGAHSLSSFQCFLSSLNQDFVIIEPNIEESIIGSQYNSSLMFSSVFDLEHFNMKSKKNGLAEMVHWNEFTEVAPRYAVYVQVKGGRQTPALRVVWQAEMTGKEVSCFTDHVSLDDDNYGQQLAKAKSVHYKFKNCIVRVVELQVTSRNAWRNAFLDVQSVQNSIFGELQPTDTIVMFNVWFYPEVVPVHKPANGLDCLLRHTMSQFRPSKQLIRDAEYYEKRFLGGQNRLAVMIRVERLVGTYFREKNIQPAKQLDTLKECFHQVQTLKQTTLNVTKLLVTIDVIGQFKSRTAHPEEPEGKYFELSEQSLLSLYDNQWTVKEWDESFIQAAGSLSDPSYVAALQRTLASRADCLILVGGGSFQILAVRDYLTLHGKVESRCLHMVCVLQGSDLDGVYQAIKNYRPD